MCTLVVLRRPGHDWPLIVAANRDEMVERPAHPPARHWPDRSHVVAGIDRLAGGTWLGLNDDGIVAGVLNRVGALGPAAGYRSRGELPLEALDHAEARVAADALSDIDPAAYRAFNLVVADARDAYWLWSSQGEPGATETSAVGVRALPPGVSMLTAFDLDDAASPRTSLYLPRFRSAEIPDPGGGRWAAWETLLASRLHDAEAGPDGAMNVVTGEGFGTVSSSLLALPAPGRPGQRPVWLFADGPPGEAPFERVAL